MTLIRKATATVACAAALVACADRGPNPTPTVSPEEAECIFEQDSPLIGESVLPTDPKQREQVAAAIGAATTANGRILARAILVICRGLNPTDPPVAGGQVYTVTLNTETGIVAQCWFPGGVESATEPGQTGGNLAVCSA